MAAGAYKRPSISAKVPPVDFDENRNHKAVSRP